MDHLGYSGRKIVIRVAIIVVVLFNAVNCCGMIRGFHDRFRTKRTRCKPCIRILTELLGSSTIWCVVEVMSAAESFPPWKRSLDENPLFSPSASSAPPRSEFLFTYDELDQDLREDETSWRARPQLTKLNIGGSTNEGLLYNSYVTLTGIVLVYWEIISLC